jgi:putative tryptophan/tyrosine transport system substrate-binding protein
MRRRELLTFIGGAAAAWPLAAEAQPPPMQPVIGFINAGSRKSYARPLATFLQGLGESGFVDGVNVSIEYRWAEGQYDRLQVFAADLIRRNVNVIAATSTPAAVVAKAATTTIPIVFTTSGDPVQIGLVASLNEPGGNITGASQLNVEVAPKRLELMREIMPAAMNFGLLVNPGSPVAKTVTKELQAASSAAGVKLSVLLAAREGDFATVFAVVAAQKIEGLVIGTDTFFNSHSEELAALALSHRVPAIYQYPEFTEAGGLMSYGGNVTESYRLAGVYVGRILTGEKPASLPVQQVTKVELILNLRTAKALGLAISPTLLARADDVIE